MIDVKKDEGAGLAAEPPVMKRQVPMAPRVAYRNETMTYNLYLPDEAEFPVIAEAVCKMTQGQAEALMDSLIQAGIRPITNMYGAIV